MPEQTNQDFVPSGRGIYVDQAVAHDLDGRKLSNLQFVRLVAIGKRFVKCDFRNSTFEACYLRKCVFDSCDFRGCDFDRCHLPSTSFEGCRFDYATFDRTNVDADILRTGCPGTENLQMRFARTLRRNFHDLGDAEAVNEAILVELAATGIHLRKAAFSRESYYRRKYQGFTRLKMAAGWLKFQLLEFLWGNGEKAWKLLRTFVLVILGMAVGDVISLRDVANVQDYMQALLLSPQVFIGTVAPNDYSGAYLAGIAFTRLLAIALLISIILKRLHRR